MENGKLMTDYIRFCFLLGSAIVGTVFLLAVSALGLLILGNLLGAL